MNPFEEKQNVPENLPFEKNTGDTLEIKISKKKIKNIMKAIIIVVVIFVSAPRIIHNITSTTEIIRNETQKFPEIFPTLTSAGSGIWSFTSNEMKNVSSLLSKNLALMADLLYSRKLDRDEVIVIQREEKEILEKPTRIIIEKIGINSIISNPDSTELNILDEALNYGVVRYPKSGLLGEKDNVFLFGHSTSINIVRNQAYKSLNNLDKLKNEDIIKVQSNNREYLYKVTSVKMEKDSDVVVRFNTGKKTLTISTCNTLGNKEDRHVVRADFVTSYSIIGDKQEVVEEVAEQTTPISIGGNIVSPTPIINPAPIQPREHEYTVTPITPINNPVVSDPNGKVDLSAQITEVGILDPITKEFIATTTLKNSDLIAFKFVVSNLGTKTAEGWSFNAVLPTYPSHMYHSNSQQNLGPGERIEYAIGFDKPEVNDNAVIIVNLDPAGTIWEITKDNNIIKKYITIKSFDE